MRVTPLVVDPTRSNVRLRTFAQGLLSRLAHDLELGCRVIEGTAERGERDNEGVAKLAFLVAGIEVNGTLKNNRVDASVLTSSEQEDVLTKMQKDVFQLERAHVKDAKVRVEATLTGGNARVRIETPNGRTVERSVKVRLEPEASGGARASGAFELSLASLGATPVKGPMNAFRVKDEVEVLFDVVLSPPKS